MSSRTVLISGAGIAGPTLAYWLKQNGYHPTIVERAPKFRSGGYVVDFWGTGYTVAERMGILPALGRRGYMVKEVRIVDGAGKKVGGFDASVLNAGLKGRFVSIARGDLAEEIYRTIENGVETIFGDTVTKLDEREDGVMVSFEHAPERKFDLVIGADGLHSVVREQTFGPESRYEKQIGYCVAAFEAKGYPKRDENVYVAYATPGKQAARFSMTDDRTLFFFIFAVEEGTVFPDPHDTLAHKEFMHREFDNAGWECKAMMGVMDGCDEVYFDRVSQIVMDRWSKGRVALIGDAASCPSLLAGEGSSLAMAQAYVLAHMLGKYDGDHERAFKGYEDALRPLIERKQRSAKGFAGAFAPKTAFGIRFRNFVTKLLGIPFIAKLSMGAGLNDDFELP